MDIYNLISILSIHFIADFIFQTRNMGKNKGKNIYWLLTHVLVYTTITIFGWALLIDSVDILYLFLLTFSTHFATDFITSKVSGYCYIKSLETKHNNYKSSKWEWRFWSTIGFDQLIHSITLILTYNYLY
jgi:hypothetical protein